MANRQRSSNRRFRRVNYDRDGDAEREPLLSVSEHLDRVIVSDEKDVDEAAPQQGSRESGSSTRRRLFLPTRRGLKQNFANRCIPRSRSVLSILVLNFLGSYAFYGIVQSSVVRSVFKGTLTNDTGLVTVIQQALMVGIGYSFYPLGGILADVYIGRHRSVRFCLLLIWAATGLFAVSAAIGNNLDNAAESVVRDVFVTWLPMTCLVIYSAASGVFQISLLVFGGDQLCDAPSETVSSYIYWYYWVKNLGQFLGTITYTGIAALKPLDNDIDAFNFVPVVQPVLSMAVLTVAIVFDTCTSMQYDAEHRNSNPIRLICGVIRNSRQWRQPPPFKSAFRYGEDPPSGLDYARQHHGGKYTDEDVEDVRTFGRLVLFILSLSGFMMLYYALRNMSGHQIENCASIIEATMINKTSAVSEAEGYVLGNLESLLNTVFIILLVPLCNSFLFPLLGFYLPNMRKRIGFGVIILLLTSVATTFLELNVWDSPEIRLLWFVLPVFLVSFAEVSTIIPLLEFVYAQSPDNMKGLLTGVCYLLLGIWNTLLTVVIFYFTKYVTTDDCGHRGLSVLTNPTLWYYAAATAIGCLIGVAHFIVAYFYKNRTHNNPISNIMRVSMYF